MTASDQIRSAEQRPLASCSVEFDLGSCCDHAEALFLREVAGRSLRHVARSGVPIASPSEEILTHLAELVEASDCWPKNRKSALLRDAAGEILLVELRTGWAHVTAAGTDRAAVNAACELVAESIRAPDPDEDLVPIIFWALDSRGKPASMHRSLEAPAWPDISDNYNDTARAGMDGLLRLVRVPSERMILWHGPPGTGKTHALRALARAWKEWCDVSFIVDPEDFFGSSPTYLLDVVGERQSDDEEDAGRRSQLIVLEDAGELMTVEARRQTGQGLSRLLNVTDGLLGQGLQVMVLITTNEPLDVLHPAIIRPGRCLADIEFGLLSAEESNAWLRQHGVERTVDHPASLADLYAIMAGHAPARAQHPTVGFSAALEAA